jgi:D-aminoacyl-tRNA deacylase
MKIAIICSTEDPASRTIRSCLLELYKFKETKDNFEGVQILELQEPGIPEAQFVRLCTTTLPPVHCEDFDKKIQADLFIFATKHEAKSKIPSLSLHTQGNWARAELGGKERQLGISPANYLKEGLRKLEELSPELKSRGFEVIQECTHHGPFLTKPAMFIEIGSSEEQWDNREAGKIIAQVIHHLSTRQPQKSRTAVGIGGPHHTPNFKKIILGTDIAIGHVCPKYMLASLDKEMLLQALERTEPKADLIILDWKGLEDKERLLALIAETGTETKRTKEF